MVFQKDRINSISVPSHWEPNKFTLGEKVLAVDCTGVRSMGIVSGMEYIFPEDYLYEPCLPKEGWEYRVRVIEGDRKFVEPVVTVYEEDMTPYLNNA